MVIACQYVALSSSVCFGTLALSGCAIQSQLSYISCRHIAHSMSVLRLSRLVPNWILGCRIEKNLCKQSCTGELPMGRSNPSKLENRCPTVQGRLPRRTRQVVSCQRIYTIGYMWYNDVQASYKTNQPSLFIFKVWFCLCDAVATSYVDDFVDPHHRVKRGKEWSISNNNLSKMAAA
jgi:hypothetical protein